MNLPQEYSSALETKNDLLQTKHTTTIDPKTQPVATSRKHLFQKTSPAFKLKTLQKK